jgi:hypothetical protein
MTHSDTELKLRTSDIREANRRARIDRMKTYLTLAFIFATIAFCFWLALRG